MHKSILVPSLVICAMSLLPLSNPVEGAGDHEGGHGHGEAFAFGKPAEGAQPDRSVTSPTAW